MDNDVFNAELAALIDAWCERRELGLLAGILPAYLGNNGLTDGVSELSRALHSAYGVAQHVSPQERDTIWVEVDAALRNR